MPTKKNLEKSAKKTYKKAKDAVEEAQSAAKKLDKKTRAKADELHKDLKKTKATTKKSSADLASAKTASKSAPSAGKATPKKRVDALYTPPLPHAVSTAVTATDGTTEEVDLGAMTLIKLRTLAKSRGLTGYTRLPKAALVERLSGA